jgi:hypothetical protein
LATRIGDGFATTAAWQRGCRTCAAQFGDRNPVFVANVRAAEVGLATWDEIDQRDWPIYVAIASP